jgi:hypothetical protein
MKYEKNVFILKNNSWPNEKNFSIEQIASKEFKIENPQETIVDLNVIN